MTESRFLAISSSILTVALIVIPFATHSQDETPQAVGHPVLESSDTKDNPISGDAKKPMPDIEGIWEMGTSARFGLCSIHRVADEKNVYELDFRDTKKTKQRVEWVPKFGRFLSTESFPVRNLFNEIVFDGWAACIITPDDNAKVLLVKWTLADEEKESFEVVIDALKARGATQDEIDEVLHPKWTWKSPIPVEKTTDFKFPKSANVPPASGHAQDDTTQAIGRTTPENTVKDVGPKLENANNPMPDISGIWEMGTRGEFGLCNIRRMSDGNDFELDLRDTKYPKVRVIWDSKLRGFQSNPTQSAEKDWKGTVVFRITPDPADNNRTMLVELILDELAEKSFEETKAKLKADGMNSDEIDNIRRLKWKRRSPAVTKKSANDGPAPTAKFAPAPELPSDRIESKGVLLLETKDGLSAFSKALGTWESVIVGLPKNGEARLKKSTLGGSFAVVVIDDQLLGYSSEAGRWGGLTIPEEFVGSVKPYFGMDLVSVKIGDRTYALSPKTAEWTSPDIGTVPTEVSLSSENTADEVKYTIKIRLNKLDPTHVVNTLNKLFEGGKIAVLGDSVTHDIAVNGSRKQLDHVEVLLKEMGEPDARSDSQQTELKLRSGIDTSASRRVADEIAKLDSQAATLAEKIRVQTKSNPNDAGGIVRSEKRRRELNSVLSKAFDLKNQLEQLRVRELQSRLSHLEQQIGRRQSQRTQIIERRARELIEGDETKWSGDPPGDKPAQNQGPRISHDPQTANRTQTNATIPADRTRIQFKSSEIRSGISAFVVEIDKMWWDLPVIRDFGRDEQKLQNYGLFWCHRESRNAYPFVVDIYPSNPSSAAFLRSNVVPIEFTGEDLVQVASGNFVVKVAFIPHAKFQELAVQTTETVVSTNLSPGIDPVIEAEKRGTVLAVVRFSPVVEASSRDDVEQSGISTANQPNANNNSNALKRNEQNREATKPASTSPPTYKELATGFVEARHELESAARALDRHEKLHKTNNTTKDELDQANSRHDLARKKYQILKDDYKALLDDTELQLKHAKTEKETAGTKANRLEKLEDGAVSKSQIDDAKLRFQQAELAFERLKVRYGLYKKAGESLAD